MESSKIYDEILAFLDDDVNKYLTINEARTINVIFSKIELDEKIIPYNDVNLLFSACRRDDYEFAKYLLDHGANPNFQDDDGNFPLKIPIIEGFVDIVDLFLKYNVNIDIQDDQGYTPLHIACVNGKVDIVKILLSQNAGANVNSKSLSEETPIHCAASWGRVPEIFDLLYLNGADIESRSEEHLTPLMTACFFNNYVGVSKLISYGCDLDAQNNFGDTALMFSEGNIEITKILVENGCDINIKNNDGDTALDVAENLSNSDESWFDPKNILIVVDFLRSISV